jgi:hypothetical protein
VTKSRTIVGTALLLAGASAGVGVLVPAGSPSAPVARAVPEPAPIPKRWQLDIRPGPVRVATINVEGVGPTAFFYFTYTVVNNTGEDLIFAPQFDLATDDGDLIRSGRDVPDSVVQALLTKLNNPMLESELSITRGTLQQGEENGREGLVVWRGGSLTGDELTVYAAGFSGETRIYKRPDTGEDVVLRKVLMLKHATPGDLAGRGSEPLERTETRWTMR